MKTVFAYFQSIRAVDQAVSALLGLGLPAGEMNVILPPGAGRAESSADTGLNQLLSSALRVSLADAGEVLAVGAVATALARTAGSDEGERTLRQALLEFDLPEQTAEAFANGIKGGGVVFFVRTPDHQAEEASHLLSETGGRLVRDQSSGPSF